MASASRFGALWVAIALTGCAAPYAPYPGNDAAKVRLTLANGFSNVGGTVYPVVDGKCGPPTWLQPIFHYSGPPRDAQGRIAGSQGSGPPVLYSRAGMVDSPDPLRSDTVELQMAPGKHLFSFFAGTGRAHCSFSAGIDLQPGRQYMLEFRFDPLAQKCMITAKRWEATDKTEWQSYGFMARDVCKGG